MSETDRRPLLTRLHEDASVEHEETTHDGSCPDCGTCENCSDLVESSLLSEIGRLRGDLKRLAGACSWDTVCLSHVGETPFKVKGVDDYSVLDRILRPYAADNGSSSEVTR